MVCLSVLTFSLQHFIKCCRFFAAFDCCYTRCLKSQLISSRLLSTNYLAATSLLLLALAFNSELILADGLELDSETFIERGEEITYVVSVPQPCKQGACGLIVDVHGGTMNAAKQNQETNLRKLGVHAENYGALSPYIVVQPELLRNDYRWQPRDMQNIMTFINSLSTKFQIRHHDTHFGGFSQGGVMAAWMICNRQHDFISYSAIAGGAEKLVSCIEQGVIPSEPLFYIHGREDLMMSFTHAQALQETVNEKGFSDWKVKFYFHDMRGGIAGAHCVPGGQGRFGCGEQSIGIQILQFYIAQSKAERVVALNDR